ncbi:MAG: NAD(P)/FAD-dependent oxidoreductase [Candidatus Hadarchaeales archaeon]
MPERYDVVVVGGGPAGLSAAKAAASEGGKVLLLEMQSQIGGQTRSAAWVPYDVAKSFEGAVVEEVHELTLSSPRRQLKMEGDFGVILDRRIFDKLLALEAVTSGADIWVSCPVKELMLDGDVVKGVYAEAGAWAERIESEVVIDASGSQGQWSSLLLRKVLKQEWGSERLSMGSEYLMANASASGVEIYFTSYFAPLGHAWIYPFGERFAMVGIRGIRIHPDAALDEFIGRRSVPSLKRAVPIAAFRGQLPIEGALPQTCADGIIAVGSAAGQVYPFSGEGLRYALLCGEIAGKVAVDAIAEGDVSRQALSEYERLWRAKLEAGLNAGQLLYDALRTSFDRKMDGLLDAMMGDVQLQRSFVDIFLGINLEASLRLWSKKEELLQIFGNDVIAKALAPYES